MIVYHQAYDLYHTVYRLLQLLTYFDRDNTVELDRLRIWDFYLLFPEKMYGIKLKREEKDISDIIKQYIPKRDNPYEILLDNRKTFEKIKPYQLTALKCLASYGIVQKDLLNESKVNVVSKNLLQDYTSKFEPLSIREVNVIHLLTSHFYLMPMSGPFGLKERTKLLESKYDA